MARDHAHEQFKWVGKRLTHVFEGGWGNASFKGAAEGEQKIFAEVSLDDDLYVSSYKDTAVSLVHDLKLGECGLHNLGLGYLGE